MVIGRANPGDYPALAVLRPLINRWARHDSARAQDSFGWRETIRDVIGYNFRPDIAERALAWLDLRRGFQASARLTAIGSDRPVGDCFYVVAALQPRFRTAKGRPRHPAGLESFPSDHRLGTFRPADACFNAGWDAFTASPPMRQLRPDTPTRLGAVL